MEMAKQVIRLLATVAAIAVSAGYTYGQNILYELPNIDAGNSIIRYYEGEKAYVIYTDDGTSRKFIYFDPSTSSAVSADFTSTGIIVNDMKIVDKTLYFCGEKNGSNNAVFGLFNVYDLFFSSGAIKYSFTPTYTAYVSGATAVNENLNRFLQIEVQHLSSTDIHIYMIAEANYTMGGTTSNDYRCIVDVWETGVGGGTAYSQEQFSGVYYFNDLVMTDNDLVVVGDKRGGTAQYMHKYSLPTAMSSTIFPAFPTPIPYWFSDAAYYYPVPEVRVTHIKDSAFAVACYGAVLWNHKSIMVSVYNGISNLVDRIVIDDPYNTYQIRDFEYRCDADDTNKGYLYFVPEYSQTNKRNSQYVIDLIGYTMTAVSMLTPSIDEVHSLTLNDYKTELSGINASHLMVWHTDIPNNLCATGANVPFDHFWDTEYDGKFTPDLNGWPYLYRIVSPIITNETVNFQCK